MAFIHLVLLYMGGIYSFRLIVHGWHLFIWTYCTLVHMGNLFYFDLLHMGTIYLLGLIVHGSFLHLDYCTCVA